MGFIHKRRRIFNGYKYRGFFKVFYPNYYFPINFALGFKAKSLIKCIKKFRIVLSFGCIYNWHWRDAYAKDGATGP